MRERLKKRGLKLMLDFVPNHMAPDHPWVGQHPDYFIGGSEIDLARAPRNYFRVPTKNGSRLFAHGRDPYFDGWPDTIQLNYGNPELQQAMIGELLRIAGQCDGVRCDMAMLVLPEVFERTWGQRRELLRQARKDVGKVFIVALILDSIYQVVVHSSIYTLELPITATVMAIVPYAITRGIVTRIARRLGVKPVSGEVGNQTVLNLRRLVPRIWGHARLSSPVISSAAWRRTTGRFPCGRWLMRRG